MWGRRRKSNEPALLDAEAEHRAAPRTFSIPRRVVRESLKPGDLVKLLFRVDPPVGSVRVERMWVEVLEARPGGYIGRLDNDPAYAPNLKAGDRVAFVPEHVAARWAQEDDPLYANPTAFAIVSRRVWDGDEWPRRVERREIPDPQFSGWFVFAGDEPDQYLADPMNFIPIAQADAFDRFRVLDSGLEGLIGTTMVWDDDALEYRTAPAVSG